MKTKLKQFSKRTISIVLALVMLISMAVVGIVTVHAADVVISKDAVVFWDNSSWNYSNV